MKVIGEAEFTDAYGHSSVQDAATVTMSRRTADKINWATFPDMAATDYTRLLYVADDYQLHPTLVW